jgi:hypothetical protein
MASAIKRSRSTARARSRLHEFGFAADVLDVTDCGCERVRQARRAGFGGSVGGDNRRLLHREARHDCSADSQTCPSRESDFPRKRADQTRGVPRHALTLPIIFLFRIATSAGTSTPHTGHPAGIHFRRLPKIGQTPAFPLISPQPLPGCS